MNENRQTMIRAAVGAALIGAGLALMLSASRRICADCGGSPEIVDAEVVIVEESEAVADD